MSFLFTPFYLFWIPCFIYFSAISNYQNKNTIAFCCISKGFKPLIHWPLFPLLSFLFYNQNLNVWPTSWLTINPSEYEASRAPGHQRLLDIPHGAHEPECRPRLGLARRLSYEVLPQGPTPGHMAGSHLPPALLEAVNCKIRLDKTPTSRTPSPSNNSAGGGGTTSFPPPKYNPDSMIRVLLPKNTQEFVLRKAVHVEIPKKLNMVNENPGKKSRGEMKKINWGCSGGDNGRETIRDREASLETPWWLQHKLRQPRIFIINLNRHQYSSVCIFLAKDGGRWPKNRMQQHLCDTVSQS